MPAIRFKFDRFSMVELSELSAADVAAYFLHNRTHLAESMPLRDVDFYTENFWTAQIERYRSARKLGCELRWFLHDGQQVIGHVALDQIIRGPFQACYLGYGMHMDWQGRGLMRVALSRSLDYVFRELGLNRVMANYEPSNARSGSLLESLGFVREGYANRYLKLNGLWKDHVLTSLIADEYLARAAIV